MVKNLPANAGDVGDLGLIPGSERSPGGGNGKPLQHSCLGNPKDRGAQWPMVSKKVRHNRVQAQCVCVCVCVCVCMPIMHSLSIHLWVDTHVTSISWLLCLLQKQRRLYVF